MKVDLAILGTGTVAKDAALWGLQCGLTVQVISRTPESASRCETALRQRLASLNASLDPTGLSVVSRERTALDATWVLETIPEDPALKREAWAWLLAHAPEGACLLSATSSLARRAFLPQVPRAEQVITFHPFVPMHRMKVVELALDAGPPAALQALARTLADRLGLHRVEVQDQAGLAASRLGLAQGLEAIRLLEAGQADAEALDTLMMKGYGHPVGPLELTDRVGLDVRLAIATALHAQDGNPVFAPPPLLVKMVEAGRLGRKAGSGFYLWAQEGPLHGNASSHTRRGRALRDPLAGL